MTGKAKFQLPSMNTILEVSENKNSQSNFKSKEQTSSFNFPN